MISPFIWPKKSLTLQLRVVICILLVIAGRVANVYVPVYSAKIGIEYLTYTYIYFIKKLLNNWFSSNFSGKFDCCSFCVPMGYDINLYWFNVFARKYGNGFLKYL